MLQFELYTYFCTLKVFGWDGRKLYFQCSTYQQQPPSSAGDDVTVKFRCARLSSNKAGLSKISTEKQKKREL